MTAAETKRPGLTGRWSVGTSAWDGPESQTPGGKAGVHVSEIACANSLDTASHPGQVGNSGNPLEIPDPRRQTRANLAGRLCKDGSLRPGAGTVLPTRGSQSRACFSLRFACSPSPRAGQGEETRSPIAGQHRRLGQPRPALDSRGPCPRPSSMQLLIKAHSSFKRQLSSCFLQQLDGRRHCRPRLAPRSRPAPLSSHVPLGVPRL